MTGKTLAIAALSLSAFRAMAFGQTAPAAILTVDVGNTVFYVNDVSDYSKFAIDANPTTAISPKNFISFIGIADIVTVNGQPAKGVWVVRSNGIFLRTDPIPGQAIGDTIRNTMVDQAFEILQSDGRAVGTITASGLGGLGPPPPGAPLSATASNFTITGGTGAFLGIRGQLEFVVLPADARGASVTEDPSERRVNPGGGSAKFVFHLLPMSRPEIVTTAAGPAVFHADFSPVTASNPARGGEVLILTATGLGPTRPGVDPGEPFPLNAVQEVNSNVEAGINGKPATVVNKIGWPGATDTYRVDVRLPEGTPSGVATIRLSAAWIQGPEARISVR